MTVAAHVQPMSWEWKPDYLRRRVLLCFILIFGLLLACVEALYTASRRYQGLSDAHQQLHYLWTFGPPAALTLLALFWSRVAFQAKSCMPWLAMSNGPSKLSRSLFLDYVSMAEPKALITAFSNGHYSVAIATGISLLLKLQIVLSTGFFTQEQVQLRSDNIPVLIEGTWAPVNLTNTTFGLSPSNGLVSTLHDVVYGLTQQDLPQPKGLLGNTIFQPFSVPDFPTSKSQVTVEGLVLSAKCSPVETRVFFTTETQSSQTSSQDVPVVNIEANVPCQPQWNTTASYYATDDALFFIRDLGLLNGSSCASPGYKYFVGFYYPTDTTTNHTGVVCTLNHTKGDFSVTEEGSNVAAQFIGYPQKNALGWNLSAAIDSTWTSDGVPPVEPGDLKFSGSETSLAPSAALLLYERDFRNVTTLELLDAALLGEVFRNMFEQYGAIVAKYLLMQPASLNSTGSAFTNTDRLVVSRFVSLLMGSIFALAFCLTACIILLTTAFCFFPHTPHTILGVALLLMNSRNFLRHLHGSGHLNLAHTEECVSGYDEASFRRDASWTPEIILSPDLEHMREVTKNDDSNRAPRPSVTTIRHKGYYPLILRPISRIGIGAILAAMIALLISFQVRSNRANGIVTVSESSSYQHLLWTSLPTVIASATAAYFVSCTFTVRALAPFWELCSPSHPSESVNVTFLDDLGFPSALRSVRQRKWALLSSITASFLTAFLSILVGMLFSVANISQSSSVQLQQETWLATGQDGSTASAQAARNILINNMSYPQWTYNDLVFPEMSLRMDSTKTNLSSARIEATLTALRNNLSCTLYPDATKYEDAETDEFPCGLTPYSARPYGQNLDFGEIDDYLPLASGEESCFYSFLYRWGRLDNNSFSHLSALVCNDSWVEVDVNVTLAAANLTIDVSRPPVPDESTARPVSLQSFNLSGYTEKQTYYSDSVDNIMFDPTSQSKLTTGTDYFRLAPFFISLILSDWAIPREFLRHETHAHEVAQAIMQQHRLIQAQFLNLGERTRLRYNETSDFAPFTTSRPPPVDAKMVRPDVARLVQNSAVTWVLVAVLAAILVLNVISGWITPRIILPKKPMSIIAIASYLADSNIFRYIPEGAESMSKEEVHRHLQGLLFVMDWVSDGAHGSPHEVYSIHVLEGLAEQQ